jgi:Polyketide cyclase / dehydrase and lipid transport
MKELHGTASSAVTAGAQESFELLRTVEDYPRWYPEVVREAQMLDADRARAKLHVAYGPLVRDFDLTLAITSEEPHTIRLTRVPHDMSDPEEFEVAWTVADGAITVTLDARLSVPRLLPVGGIGESMARGFVEAAARALSRSR